MKIKRFEKPLKIQYKMYARILNEDNTTEWIECNQIDLGSKNNPNKKVLEIKLIPVQEVEV